MRILFVAPRFHTNQYELVKTLQEKKHEVFFHVAAIGTTEDHSLLTPTRYKQSKFSLLIEKFRGQGGLNRKYYFPSFIYYYKELLKLKPDIVIIRNPYRFFSVVAAFCSLIANKKIIFYTLEELFRFRTKKTVLKQNITMRFFKAAWMTPILGNDDGKYVKLKHMYYIPMPMKVKSENQVIKNIPDEGPRILMVGKYHQERKKHLLFIEAINNLKSKCKFKVTIVGECIRETQKVKFNIIQETIHRLGLSDVIDLRKGIPFSEMEKLYTSHHVFVLPAINEPYGVSVTEALGYGLPVICTDTCGAKFNIRNGENGFVVKSNSIDELTTALEVLISNKENLCKMSERSFNYVRNNLSGNAFYTSFLHLVNERFRLQCSD